MKKKIIKIALFLCILGHHYILKSQQSEQPLEGMICEDIKNIFLIAPHERPIEYQFLESEEDPTTGQIYLTFADDDSVYFFNYFRNDNPKADTNDYTLIGIYKNFRIYINLNDAIILQSKKDVTEKKTDRLWYKDATNKLTLLKGYELPSYGKFFKSQDNSMTGKMHFEKNGLWYIINTKCKKRPVGPLGKPIIIGEDVHIDICKSFKKNVYIKDLEKSWSIVINKKFLNFSFLLSRSYHSKQVSQQHSPRAQNLHSISGISQQKPSALQV